MNDEVDLTISLNDRFERGVRRGFVSHVDAVVLSADTRRLQVGQGVEYFGRLLRIRHASRPARGGAPGCSAR